MRSSLWAHETARARHRAADSLCATVCPPNPTFTAYTSAGQIRLCYIPSLVSSVLITSRHNTSCSSTFPGPRWQRGVARGRPALVWKLQTCSCHCVSPWLWFYCVTYGLCLGMFKHCARVEEVRSGWWIVQFSGCRCSSVHAMAILHEAVM